MKRYLVEKVHFVFSWMNVDVDILRTNFNRHVHERVAALGKVRAVHHLDRLLDGRRVDLEMRTKIILKN